jgi:hypothetical protein
MTRLITDLDDGDIRTEWRAAAQASADDDGTDGDDDAADADDDASDADDDATDAGDADGTDA